MGNGEVYARFVLTLCVFDFDIVFRFCIFVCENLRVSTTEEPQPPPTDLLTLPTESQQLLSEAQLAQMQSITSRCVEQAAAEIASKAVRAAVQAMSNSTSCASGSNASNNIPVVLDESKVRLVNEGNIPTLTAS